MNVSRGFTLIEILVALVIIALVGLSSQQRISQFHDERGILRDRQQAHWQAWNQLMLQYQIAQDWYPSGDEKPNKTGSEVQLERTWYYHTERQATVTENFYRFEASIYDAPHSAADISNNQQTSASLVLFLVQQ